MSDLPNGWCWTTIGDITSKVETTDPKHEPTKFFTYVDIGSIDNSTQTIVEPKTLPGAEAPSRARQVLRVGDTVFSTVRTYLRNIGYVDSSLDGAIGSTGFSVLRPVPGVNSRYLHYYSLTSRFIYGLSEQMRGTSYPAVVDGQVREMEMPLAPTAEQERIVAAIEEQLSRLDTSAATLERIRQNLKRLRSAVLLAAVQGTLVAQCADDEPAAEAITRVKARTRFRGTQEPLDSSMGPLPPGWAWARVGKLAARVTVGHVGPTKGKYVPEGVPFLRSQNVRADYFDPSGLVYISPHFHRALAKSVLSPGDVVIVRSGVNRGMACVVPEFLGEANCADLVIVQRPEGIHPRFLSFFINSLAQRYVRSEQVGVAIPHFNTQSLSALPVPVPPVNEQFRIVEEADRILSSTESLAEIVNRQVARSSTLRSGVLATAFSGSLVPQDPTDEPASNLLERIATGVYQGRGRKLTRSIKSHVKVEP